MNKQIKIPWFPLSVLAFFILLMLLWNLKIIPKPEELIFILEKFVDKIGILGIFVVTFLEGLAYIGHQFPGSSLVIISLIVASNDFTSLVTIVIMITLAITLSSLVNYYMGTIFSGKKIGNKKKLEVKSTLLLSAIHPNFLSLYFFNKGLNKSSIKEIFFVPIIIFPYGLIVALIVSSSSNFIREKILPEGLFFLFIFGGWFLIEFILKNKAYLKSKLK